MNHITKTITRNVALSLICFLPMSLVWSADEDMISQVYLEFDPETGEFVTAMDPTLSNNSMHNANQAQQVQQIQESQAAINSGDQTNTQPVAGAPSQQQPMDSSTAGGSSSTMLIVGVIVLGLLVGVVLRAQKNKQAA